MTKAKLKKELQILFNKWIIRRDVKCIVTGKTILEARLTCSHFWNEGTYPSVRYDPENCDTISWAYHYGNPYVGWEFNKQGDYRDFKIKQLGIKKYKLLEERAKRGYIDWRAEDLMSLIDCLKNGGDYVKEYAKFTKKRLKIDCG